MIVREAVCTEVRTWIGTPFRHQGRLKGVGVDCVGLVVGVARALGLVLKDHRLYHESFYDSKALEVGLSSQLDQREIPTPGDVVLLNMHHLEPGRHVAFFLGETLVHCWDKRGVVEHTIGVWEGRIRAVFAFREAELSWPL